MTEHISCDFKLQIQYCNMQFKRKMEWNNNTYQCECKNY